MNTHKFFCIIGDHPSRSFDTIDGAIDWAKKQVSLNHMRVCFYRVEPSGEVFFNGSTLIIKAEVTCG